MRDELDDVLELYGGMPPEGQIHWRRRSLPAVEFVSDGEREEFMAALATRDKQPTESAAKGAETPPAGSQSHVFSPGQRVKANLGGMTVGGVQFSQNVEAAYAVVDQQVSAEPPVYRLKLLISFHGVSQVDVPAGRIRAM